MFKVSDTGLALSSSNVQMDLNHHGYFYIECEPRNVELPLWYAFQVCHSVESPRPTGQPGLPLDFLLQTSVLCFCSTEIFKKKKRKKNGLEKAWADVFQFLHSQIHTFSSC